MTREILFYDCNFDVECKSFCRDRNITFLPCKTNSNICYEVVGDKIKERQIEKSQRVEIKDDLFEDSVLPKFEKHNILFVYDKNRIVGVVHFCDYNRDPVFLTLYPQLLKFEKKLRILLISNGLKNEDMLKFFNEKKDKDFYREKSQDFEKPTKIKGMRELEPFQMFDLKDLIALATSKGFVKKFDFINDLRNTIMHVKNAVKKKDFEVGNLIYSIESFQSFFKSVKQIQPMIDEISKKTLRLKEPEEITKLKESGLIFDPSKTDVNVFLKNSKGDRSI